MKYTSCKICSGTILPENSTNELVKCASCKLAFYENDFTDLDIDAYYKDVYEKEYHNFNNTAKNMSDGMNVKIGYNKSQVMKRVLANNPANIGEIGAGIGLIANYLKEKNVVYTGFEPVAHIVENAKKEGLNIEQADFTILKEHANKFDAIVAFEVIEHIDNLKNCLALIFDALKANGRFGFTVPNYDKRLNYANRGDKIYQSGPPLHVNFFTKESIAAMASLLNFKVEYLATRPFPQAQKTLKENLRLISRVVLGNFYGSTIFCMLKKD
ncbi:MAG: class I SAM-dependent methyltransferase [Chitinophagaceae bacterium]|nr:class I SAM-dependent methyltransferase [Chitinophagaceae bacterium]